MGFLLAILAFFMLYPVYDICKLSFFHATGSLRLRIMPTYFTNPRMFRSFTNSLYVSIVTMVITTVLAFFFAYGLTRTTIRGKGTFLYDLDLSPDRSLHHPGSRPDPALRPKRPDHPLLLHTDWNIYGATGIIVAECLYCFPNALFILYTTLSAVDTRLDEAAQSLGASALKTFYKVTLPSAKYGIASAAALVFNLTITDFGVPVVIGGNYSVSGYRDLSAGHRNATVRSRGHDQRHPLDAFGRRLSPELLPDQEELCPDQRAGAALSAALPALQEMGLHNLLLDPLPLYPDRSLPRSLRGPLSRPGPMTFRSPSNIMTFLPWEGHGPIWTPSGPPS